ncbi:hypothetical protein Asppvi_008502 [Aspergillus pseudoviridinutans]|uniref:Uncharacterized protein n=1 Tax=Aspergillus pseudoviridinutans TaxID=1517512 RepID=A0A9P3EY80_9EURO|nr:uncharacterized protein Asppvi_008502 [Aspergillus pseudoviridinutans]GIJ89560.1 hypothetical protein Asppvi_008502 [Aspergillus pseudoviridinutans]
MDPYMAIIYYLFLLLLFGYFMVFHFLNMTSIPSSSSSAPSPDPASINEQVDEIDDDSFYHPSWRQRWSHPEFAGYYSNNWRKESWSEQQRRLTTRFLIPLLDSKFPWGYMIYRTVYTAESDKLWPIAMDKLTQIMNYSIESDLYTDHHKEPEDPEPDSTAEQLVKELCKDVIFSDKKF